MSISYHIENHPDFLKVVAHGKDDNLEDVNQYQQAIMEAVYRFGCKKILCDERDLIYAISVFDTYQLGETVAKYAKELIKVAIVCKNNSLEEGRFFETVASNRGLCILVTADYDKAVAWLTQ